MFLVYFLDIQPGTNEAAKKTGDILGLDKNVILVNHNFNLAKILKCVTRDEQPFFCNLDSLYHFALLKDRLI